MNISIIIPNYNGEAILQKNLPLVLEAVKEYKEGSVEIIIPDDPSTDNSHEVIESFIADIHVPHIVGKTIHNKNPHESGFSKNVMRGVSLATGDILILLNSDVAPHRDFLKPLLAHFADETVFGVACMDESIEDGKVVLRGRGVGKWQRGFLMHSEGKLDKTNTLWLSGGSSAFRKTYWDKLHGLDLLYNPFYWEDIDLGYRGLKSGYKLVFEKKSIVRHEHESGAIKTKFTSKHVQKIAYRNQFIFVWKNITDTSLRISHFMWLPYHLISALRRGDMPFLKGFFLACLLIPQINNSRKKARTLFTVTDKELIDSVST